MNARLKKIFDPEQDSHDLEKKDAEASSKKKRLSLVDLELPPYYVSQFEKNPKGWIWDLILGFYVLVIIAVVAYIELRS